MARRADQKNDLRRKKRHRGLKLSAEQRQRGRQLSPERRRWRTAVLVISGIFFLAGILIVIVPMATMATMVPAPALIFGVICIIVSLALPMCFLCRSQRDDTDIENTGGSVFQAKPLSETSEKLNLSFESEQQMQLGCLQTTPKIFRFSKDRNRDQQHPQRLPFAAFTAGTARVASPGNNSESEVKAVSGWRNIEIKRKEDTERTERTEHINQGFLRESPEVGRDQGSSEISTGELMGKIVSPDRGEPGRASAAPSTLTETNNKVTAEKNNNGNKRFSFNINKSSKNQKRKFQTKEKNQRKENAYINESFQNDFVLDSESKASYELTKEVDVDLEINEGTEDNPALNLNSSNFISKKMLESFNRNSKKNAKMENTKPGHNLISSIRTHDQFPPEKSKNTGGQSIPVLTFTPPSPPSPPLDKQREQAEDEAGGKQILLKSNNFSKSEGEKKRNLNKEAKQKTQSLLKNKKKNKAEHSRVPTVNKPKSSTKSSKKKEKPMKTPKQKTKDNPVIIEFESEPKNEASSPELTVNPETKVSFKRKGFQRKSSGEEGPSQATSIKGEPSRLYDVLKVFKAEKGRKEKKKTKSPCSITNKADLMMSGESVKDKYITNNFGPRQLAEEEDGDTDTDSPPLVHFGNIPTDVDLIGMRIKNQKDSRKSQLSNFDQDEEEEDGKFSDVLKFLSKKDRIEGKVKKNKKVPPLSKKPSNQPKCRSIDEINKMLVDIADNKSTGSGATQDYPQLDQKLLERSLFVNFNPGGLKRHGGSMESFDDTSSVGSTGSYSGSTNSTGSITYPVRSSMKKPRKAGSTASGDSAGGQSKKSVSYAIGSEQTAV